MRLYQLVATGEDRFGGFARRYSRIVYTHPPGDPEIDDFMDRLEQIDDFMDRLEPRDSHDMGCLEADKVEGVILELCDNTPLMARQSEWDEYLDAQDAHDHSTY